MVAHTKQDCAAAYAIASAVPDPELPFISVGELGILRDIIDDNGIMVAHVSPTYSGCPAVSVIEDSILAALSNAGYHARIERVLSPPWTTDWISDEGRKKLKANGIAPPVHQSQSMKPVFFASVQVECPQCGSDKTEKISEFGSTPCKAQYRCNRCGEPFDYFKCH